MVEQAAALGRHTRNLVTGRVDTIARRSRFFHQFSFVIPVLDDYSFALFEVYHDQDLYPVYDATDVEIAHDEATFRSYLRELLREDRTVSIIRSLVAQARSEEGGMPIEAE